MCQSADGDRASLALARAIPVDNRIKPDLFGRAEHRLQPNMETARERAGGHAPARPPQTAHRTSMPPLGGWKGGWSERVAYAVAAVWVAVFLTVGATLTVGHFYTLPRPDTSDPAVATALNSMRNEEQAEAWLAVHILYADCRCSQRIFEHLRQDGRPSDVAEKVLLVGGSETLKRQLSEAGFEVIPLKREELAERFGLTAAPLFAVLDPTGTLRYLGGYTGRKQGLDVRDIKILAQLRDEQFVDELPLFGCAVAQELQELLDPLRIKYTK